MSKFLRGSDQKESSLVTTSPLKRTKATVNRNTVSLRKYYNVQYVMDGAFSLPRKYPLITNGVVP